MAAPTTWWICDDCGERIMDISHGWIEWLQRSDFNSGKEEVRGPRIVHNWRHSPGSKGACMYDEAKEVADLWNCRSYNLADFCGPDGMMFILELLQGEVLPIELLCEIFKRIHVNGYEAARPYFDRAIAETGMDSRPFNCYTQEEIDTVLGRFDQE